MQDEPQVPWLRAGVGREGPAGGGCIMQVLSWIEDGSWHDKPWSVHHLIRKRAIGVNDYANDQDRQRLLDLGPRMMGTNISFGPLRWRVDDALENAWRAHSVMMEPRRFPTIRDLEYLLDVFDQITGRDKVEAIDFTPVVTKGGAPTAALV